MSKKGSKATKNALYEKDSGFESQRDHLKLASNGAFFVYSEKNVPKNVPSENRFRKRFLKEHTPYKLPTIVRAKDDWFIKYFFELPEQPGTFKEFRVRDGINYIKDPVERELEAQKLCGDIKYALEKEGYSPFKKRKRVKQQIEEKKAEVAEKKKSMSLDTAVKWVVASKTEKGKSDDYLYDFTWIGNFFVPWCSSHGLTQIDEPNIDHIEQFLAEKLESEEWKPRTYNNKVAILTTFFNYLASKRKLADNPIKEGMLERIKNTAEKNKYYDQETLDRIVPEVVKYPKLQRFIRWTYYTCARGTELRGLKIKHVDLLIKKIIIMAETGKTGEHVGKRNIPLCQELQDLIAEEKLKANPGEWFIFGDKGIPGPEPMSEGYMSDIYFKVKTDLNLDFKYTIYSFKHTRVVDLLVAGFDPVKVMYITGHTSWASFQAYIRELGAVMDKQLIGNTLKLSL